MIESIEIVAGGGVVFCQENSRINVLMIHRRGVWDLPKGKIEPDETIEEGAMREVHEETGCRDLIICFPLGKTEHSYRENGILVSKKTWWYAMESGRPELKPQQSEEIDALEWVEIGDAINKAYYSNLKKVLLRFANRRSRPS